MTLLRCLFVLLLLGLSASISGCALFRSSTGKAPTNGNASGGGGSWNGGPGPGDAAAWGGGLPSVRASRLFAGPGQFPPRDFAAYGMLIFTHHASPDEFQRYQNICMAYINSIVHASKKDLPHDKQMVTVWPIDSDEIANELNKGKARNCEKAIRNYGLEVALRNYRAAEQSRYFDESSMKGDGPFLVAWSPATDRGNRYAAVLAVNMSNIATYGSARKLFRDWAAKIESNPDLWLSGNKNDESGKWNLEEYERIATDWLNKHGKTIELFISRN